MTFKHYYNCPPIDFFDAFKTLEQYITEVERVGEHPENMPGLLAAIIEGMVNTPGWERDIREGPYVFPVVNGEYLPDVALVWKQDNNGSTFIASPVPIHQISEHEVQRTIKK